MKKHFNLESILAMYVFELINMLKLDIPLPCNFTLLKVKCMILCCDNALRKAWLGFSKYHVLACNTWFCHHELG